MDALKNAVNIVGSQSALARSIGVKQQHVWRWLQSAKVPAEHVLPIEAATGHQVSRHDLRPDIYPREPWCRCPACERERQKEDANAA